MPEKTEKYVTRFWYLMREKTKIICQMKPKQNKIEAKQFSKIGQEKDKLYEAMRKRWKPYWG